MALYGRNQHTVRSLLRRLKRGYAEIGKHIAFCTRTEHIEVIVSRYRGSVGVFQTVLVDVVCGSALERKPHLCKVIQAKSGRPL
jgi:type I site-specific restriction endonuclease